MVSFRRAKSNDAIDPPTSADVSLPFRRLGDVWLGSFELDDFRVLKLSSRKSLKSLLELEFFDLDSVDLSS